jgi:hypothetical protein
MPTAASPEPEVDLADAPTSEEAKASTSTEPTANVEEPIVEATATADTAAAVVKEPAAAPLPVATEQSPESLATAAVSAPAETPQHQTAKPQSAPLAASVGKAAGSSISSYEAAVLGIAEINAKAVGAFHANSVATLAFFETLMGARSLSEAIRLQTEHARKQFETVSGQAKEITQLARRVVHDAAVGRKR